MKSIEEIEQDARKLAESGNRIGAVREMRHALGSLTLAKNWLDANYPLEGIAPRVGLSDEEMGRRGNLLARVLNLKENAIGRYPTEWGDKTPLGLFLMAERIVKEGK